MTGQELWKTFSDAGISDEHLKSLGYDLYFARKVPTGDAAVAVNKLAAKLGIEPRFAYAAMNIDPGRTVLEKLADDYGNRKAWDGASPTTRTYIARVAERVKIIRGSGSGPSGGNKAPAQTPQAPKNAAQPATSSKTAWPLAIGLGIIVAGLTYATRLVHA